MKAIRTLTTLKRTLGFILSHPMNRGRPISTLARFAWWQVESRLKDEVIVDWIDGSKLAVRRGMTGATGNVYCGLHEYVDMRFVLDMLKAGDLFIDIGANVGSYTVLASSVRGAHTIAIEPDPNTTRLLRRNIEINGIVERVQVVEAALGDSKGVVRFTVGRDTVNRVAMAEERDVQEVPMITLDTLTQSRAPTIIKMDVEGYEPKVLNGATRTLAQPSLKAIITETLNEEMLSVFSEAGFDLVHYDPENRRMVSSPMFSSKNSILVRKRMFIEENH